MRTSARMAAYRRISAPILESQHVGSRCEIPAKEHIHCWPGPRVGLIAMQKVEGSNPFSRFEVNPLHMGNSPFAGETGTTPTYPLHFGHSAQNAFDTRRLTPISLDSASLSAGGG